MSAAGTIALPRTSLPEAPVGEEEFPPIGGARGPAAIPSRLTSNFAPAPEENAGGAYGVISYHRGPWVNTGTIDRPQVGNIFAHETIGWSRPVYPNDAGVLGYVPPTQLPSWTANAVPETAVPDLRTIPVSNKRIDSFTVNQEFGSTRELFPFPVLRSIIQPRNMVQRRRWAAGAKTSSPYSPRLSIWGLAGSYGQTTTVLNTLPTNPAAPTPGVSPAMSAY
jgi:hypothetical protein